MAERNEVVGTSLPNLNDNAEINCFCGIFYPNKIKEKFGKVLPHSFPSQNDSIKLQEELELMMTPFHEYCDSESLEEKERLNKMTEQLGKVLNDEKVKYKTLYEENSRQFRKKWRDRRIEIYNYLLRHALSVTKENEGSCFKEEGFTDDFYDEAFSKLEPEQFYTYLVDQVHEDEEIMFKYYCLNKGEEKPFKWREDAKWVVASINLYRNMLIGEALDVMQPWERAWEDGNQSHCDNLVKEAKEKFLATQFNLHGRSFEERSWRNRARFYYLLGLARHTGISHGRAGKFKNFDYEGPFCHLVCKMIIEDEDLFDQEREEQCLSFAAKTKHEKQSNGSFLGCLRMDRLLAWASAANDLGFVRILLKYYHDSIKSHTNFGFDWKESIGESWAMALWNASYMGHVQIVHELLRWEIPYNLYYYEYFFDKMKKLSHEPPLHVAVSKMNISVVDAFCASASPDLICNEKNSNDLTPLDIAIKLKIKNIETKDLKRKIQKLLLQRLEVKNAIAEAMRQRQFTVDSTNAIIVGGTLIASITFGGWLQPPLGFNSYYQSVDPTIVVSPSDSNDSYMSVQGHFTIQLFAIFNSLSFYFAIASVIAGMETFWVIKEVKDIYKFKALKKLQRKLSWATNLFLASVICVLVAFSCAGIAVLPPVKKYQTNMYITIAIGGFICMIFICKMAWYALSKKFRNMVKLKFHPMFNK